MRSFTLTRPQWPAGPVAVVVGNPKPRSRTLDAATVLAQRLADREPDVVIDLVDFGARLLDWSDEAVANAVSDVQTSALLIVASPTYKASYTGLLKLFLDRFPAGSLAGVCAVPLMLGGHWRHSLAADVFLKPVLAEIGAICPTRGLFLLDSDYAVSRELDAWLGAAVPALRASLPAAL